MSSKYKFLTTHLEKAIRELLVVAESLEKEQVGYEPETMSEWTCDLWQKCQAVREALED